MCTAPLESAMDKATICKRGVAATKGTIPEHDLELDDDIIHHPPHHGVSASTLPPLRMPSRERAKVRFVRVDIMAEFHLTKACVAYSF